MARNAGIARSRALRQTASSAERHLWGLLRGRRLEALKFRRQVAVYVADFLCLRHRLVVEVDGPFHDPERDAVRDAWLSGQGFRVLRFSTHEVQSRDELVMQRIIEMGRGSAMARRGLSDPSSGRLRRPPSPAGGEGSA